MKEFFLKSTDKKENSFSSSKINELESYHHATVQLIESWFALPESARKEESMLSKHFVNLLWNPENPTAELLLTSYSLQEFWLNACSQWDDDQNLSLFKQKGLLFLNKEHLKQDYEEDDQHHLMNFFIEHRAWKCVLFLLNEPEVIQDLIQNESLFIGSDEYLKETVDLVGDTKKILKERQTKESEASDELVILLMDSLHRQQKENAKIVAEIKLMQNNVFFKALQKGRALSDEKNVSADHLNCLNQMIEKGLFNSHCIDHFHCLMKLTCRVKEACEIAYRQSLSFEQATFEIQKEALECFFYRHNDFQRKKNQPLDMSNDVFFKLFNNWLSHESFQVDDVLNSWILSLLKKDDTFEVRKAVRLLNLLWDFDDSNLDPMGHLKLSKEQQTKIRETLNECLVEMNKPTELQNVLNELYQKVCEKTLLKKNQLRL